MTDLTSFHRNTNNYRSSVWDRTGRRLKTLSCQKADRNFRDLAMIKNKILVIINIKKCRCSSVPGTNLQMPAGRIPVSTFL